MPRKSSAMDASNSAARRRGPKPLLSAELETQLTQWALARQSSGLRVSRDDVITQAQEMLRKEETQEEAKSVGMGWCNRFVARHPELNLRSGSLTNVKKGNPSSNEEILNIPVSDDMLPDAAVNDQAKASFKSPEVVNQVDLKENEGGEVEEAAELVKTRKYNRKHMEAAVEMYLAGRPMSEVTQRFPLLHQRTIRRRVLRVQRGEVDRRRGPRPLLEGEPEQELVAWILDMQSRGTRVTKHDILARANEKYRALNGGVGGEDRLKEGWLRRFKERHPVLSGRAPGKERLEEKEGLGTEEKKELLSGDGELASSTQSPDGQQELMPASERLGDQLKRSDPAVTTTENSATMAKKQRTEEKTSSVRRGAILPERRQSEKDENVRKLDAIMQSNQRLEEMQRQQLEMLKQLCASNNVLSIPTGSQQNIESTNTEE
ncbi:hypothetical protein PRIC2_013940 [Phytophthora ramorum]|uniref:uncharacterized protein n=1 Tax=Phytophthora ramorum TaxID=164328 RepID=UPI0030A8C7A1|nr:hypothetical protein KRP23_248 [Phytophthora ramorum]